MINIFTTSTWKTLLDGLEMGAVRKNQFTIRQRPGDKLEYQGYFSFEIHKPGPRVHSGTILIFDLFWRQAPVELIKISITVVVRERERGRGRGKEKDGDAHLGFPSPPTRVFVSTYPSCADSQTLKFLTSQDRPLHRTGPARPLSQTVTLTQVCCI